jgi:hypothetical protein
VFTAGSRSFLGSTTHWSTKKIGDLTRVCSSSCCILLVNKLNTGVDLSMLEDRVLNMPLCQTRRETNVYSHWEGDWLEPTFQLENSIRMGWLFLPSRRMDCKLETFNMQALRSLPEKKLMYILGRSVERGILFSFLNIMLKEDKKRLLWGSHVGR